jgi:hypothetical protein
LPHKFHLYLIIKKKIYALGKISTDLNPSELLGIAHGSICSVLYYAAGTRLNRGLQEKYLRKTKSSDKLNTADCIWEEEKRMQHSRIAQSSKRADTFTDGTVSPSQSSKPADTFTDGTVSPWMFFAKGSGCECSKRFVHPCNEPSILQRKSKNYYGYQKLDY